MKHVGELIQAYVAGELDPEEKAAVEKHLAECAECRAEADRSGKLWEMLAAADTRPPVTASVWPSTRSTRCPSSTRWPPAAGRLYFATTDGKIRCYTRK